MTVKQQARKKDQEKISELHNKYYGKKKAREAKKTEKANQQRIKATQVAPGEAKKAGVGIDDQPTRAQLMANAQKQGIKYFRILKRDELIVVLAIDQQTTLVNKQTNDARIRTIQDKAKARWKAGWGAKKKKEADK